MDDRNLKSSWISGLASYRCLGLIVFIVMVADQLSKAAMMALLPEGTFDLNAPPPYAEPVAVIPGFFYLVHVTNDGAAWSLFAGKAMWLAVLGILAIGGLIAFRKQLGLVQFPQQWIFGLIAGGIIGNVIDRLRWGHVVDFLDFHFGSYRYPAFNFADSAITVGVICYLAFTWFFESRVAEKPAEKAPVKP